MTESTIAHGRMLLGAALRAADATEPVSVLLADDRDAKAALAAAGAELDRRPESFVLLSHGGKTFVVGRDETGALYGALELAERLELDGVEILPLTAPIVGTPHMAVRGANPFLVLPAPGESAWWFLDEGFWQEYLDLLMHSRMNFLDLHAMYDLSNTIFPNASLYFASSASHPEVGVPRAERERNVAMLRKVVQMAKVRGVRVGLMSYRADPSLTGDKVDFPLDDAALELYTREATADLARQVPDLWLLGFRIGESLKPTAWYANTFIAGLHDSGTSVRPYTRTWYVPKSEILGLIGASSDDYVIEAKFNGEHLGAPYAILGGPLLTRPGHSSYSYEDYLEGPMPYTFVFQVRACSTHRIFRNASYARTRRLVGSLGQLGAQGYSFEPPHAFFPQRDYYHALEDRFSEWTFRRDEAMYLLLGRLSYDPQTDERVFRAAFARRTGSEELWPALQAASDIVPWIQMASTCGFDTRDYAPELELGGTIAELASAPAGGPACLLRAPFDPFAVASPFEAANDLVTGAKTSKLSPLEIAAILIEDARQARSVALASNPKNAEARDVMRESIALADLGEFVAHKLRAATVLAVYRATGAAAYLAAARSEAAASAAAFKQLAEHTAHIAPFEDRLRMSLFGLLQFHWRHQLVPLANDAASIDAVEAAVDAAPPRFEGELPAPEAWWSTKRPTLPAVADFAVEQTDGSATRRQVSVRFADDLPDGASVNVLWKRYANTTDWAAVTASGGPQTYTATVDADGPPGHYALEVFTAEGAKRLPDVVEETPYWTVVPPLP